MKRTACQGQQTGHPWRGRAQHDLIDQMTAEGESSRFHPRQSFGVYFYIPLDLSV
jgi:hypothetical protein